MTLSIWSGQVLLLKDVKLVSSLKENVHIMEDVNSDLIYKESLTLSSAGWYGCVGILKLYGRVLIMSEEWKRIKEFPDYSISTEGRVRNDRTSRIMALTMNQLGIVQVGFTKNHRYFKRAVAPLVAHAF